ncbi:hypothetical protein GCM10010329_34650 [Streptomyces spiroverticillatus]|uniref:Transmembrane protein n=1 Tax=Streptomyces finlayi TaxID=67296 RepID=A0A919C9R4_9ACTN|nr:hypothetical protein GCM10010329_34650 [Streptomyces spiroverticillatus]GHC91738.1 hypothetical protein GCM10010334_27060 [Streptomyces finlayi]
MEVSEYTCQDGTASADHCRTGCAGSYVGGAMNWPTAIVIIAALFALAAVLSTYFARPKK